MKTTTTDQRRKPTLKAALLVACPACGAKPGEKCRASTWRTVAPHE